MSLTFITVFLYKMLKYRGHLQNFKKKITFVVQITNVYKMFNTSQLKLLRKSKGLTQEEVAETLSISQSAYARLENGVCKTWGIYLKSLCEIFSVSPIILLNDHSLKDYDILEEKENLINTLQNKISNLETTVSILNKK